jgi:hypothetical protein
VLRSRNGFQDASLSASRSLAEPVILNLSLVGNIRTPMRISNIQKIASASAA